ncbi:Hsp70 family protein [Periweissella fabaria]|uniref:Chaperone protein DnaK n=1 Tax=Periweissella fabaria TaxID=546157 RepID=A0ABM8Z4X4_9LACO|nr:Hsp70 family protein [Periweissella fabaria]MCM0597262.1 Hsp70 family protein [Periweissella fabaria]CAH0416233.1 Chaperone protein DnaK [Periweissella fabaria]
MLIGIDFGTYDSGSAVFTNAGPTVIKTSTHAEIISSRVALGKQPLVGGKIPNYAFTNRHVIKSIKRHLGEENYRILIDGTFYTAIEVSALVLGELKQNAEAQLGEVVTETVITVPVMFDDTQRNALKQAAKLAGFEKVRLVNEPMAVALAYAAQQDFNVHELNVFYSIGAGMSNAALVEINNGIVEVLAAGGSSTLGGDEFDRMIVDWLVQDFYRQQKIDLSKVSSVMKRLTLVAEQAKIELTTAAQTTIKVVAVANVGDKSLDIDVVLTREHFNELVTPLVNAIKAPFEFLIKDAGYLLEEIDNIFLTGGSSQVPVIKDMMTKLVDTNVAVIGDQVLALKGTTIQAAILSGTLPNVTAIDVTPMAIMLEQSNGSFVKVVTDNTVLPNVAPRIPVDKTNLTPLNLLQGSDHIQQLGTIQLHNMPLGAATDECELEVSLDENGFITVKVLNNTTKDEHVVFFNDVIIPVASNAAIAVTPSSNALNPVAGVYYTSAYDAIEAAFDDGQFRYWDANGQVMQIEVPLDQYDLAVTLMAERIKNGDIPTITDPQMAQKIIQKGLFSYDQVLHLALNGNVDVIKYDEDTETIVAKTKLSISVAVAYVMQRWAGATEEAALLNTVYLGLKVSGIAFAHAIVEAEFKCLGLNPQLLKNSELILNTLGQPNSVEILKDAFSAVPDLPAATALKDQIMKKEPAIDYIDIDDIHILFKGRVEAPILYTAVKQANERHSNITSTLDQFTLTDAEFIVKVVREQFIELAHEYCIFPLEARQLVTQLVNDASGRLANALYEYVDPWTFANQILGPLFDDFAKHRYSYHLALDMLLAPLKLILEDASDVEFDEF